MALTKSEALASGISNQQALVKAMITRKREPKRMLIPGGKTLLQNLDERNLASSIFIWLRGARWFDSVTLSFVSGTVSRPSKTIKVSEFPKAANGLRPWDRQDIGGKRWLADRIADALSSNLVLSVTAKEDGLYVTTPTETMTAEQLQSAEDFMPHLDFVLRQTDEYRV
jgi:hypothetical protein